MDTKIGTINTEIGTINTEIGTINTEIGTINTEIGTIVFANLLQTKEKMCFIPKKRTKICETHGKSD